MRITSRLASVTRPPARPSLWLELADGEGSVGLGEASPFAPFSREDVTGCERALVGIDARIGEVDPTLAPAQAISAVLRRIGASLIGVPAARFALETALFDLLGQRRAVSVAECLGKCPRDPLPVSGLLFAGGDPDVLAARAAALAGEGISAIKIKLRARDEAQFAQELVALARVREVLPLPFELRLDPNGAWTVDEARRRLTALAPIAPHYVEQPVAPEHLHRLGRCAVPWAADESLAYPELADVILAAEGCGAIILKPHVLGGLIRARELAARAAERGIDVVVTHFFDGPVGMAAACELALSLPHPPLACGLDPHAGLAAWPAIPIPQLARRGLVVPSRAAGLGLARDAGAHVWMP